MKTEAQIHSVLCLLPGVPLPADTGGMLRTLALVQALDEQFDLTVLTLRRPGQDARAFKELIRGEVILVRAGSRLFDAASELESVFSGKPLGYRRYGFTPEILTRVLLRKRYDVIHFDHPHTAMLLSLVRKLQPEAKLVLDAHNVEARVIERLALTAPLAKRALLRMQARRVRKLETRVARKVDAVLTCSQVDSAEFSRMGARRVRVLPNSIPTRTSRGQVDRRDLLFVGSLDWRPNADAALRLGSEIWPLCKEALAPARLVLVGRNPPQRVKALASNSVTVTGGVKRVGPYLRSARATAIPLRVGSGTRIKILESWAAGVPVVASRVAAEGLPYRDGRDLIIAETPEEFAQALVRIWRDPVLAARLAEGGRTSAEPFTQRQVAAQLIQFYREGLSRSAARASEEASKYNLAYSPAIASTP